MPICAAIAPPTRPAITSAVNTGVNSVNTTVAIDPPMNGRAMPMRLNFANRFVACRAAIAPVNEPTRTTRGNESEPTIFICSMTNRRSLKARGKYRTTPRRSSEICPTSAKMDSMMRPREAIIGIIFLQSTTMPIAAVAAMGIYTKRYLELWLSRGRRYRCYHQLHHHVDHVRLDPCHHDHPCRHHRVDHHRDGHCAMRCTSQG